MFRVASRLVIALWLLAGPVAASTQLRSISLATAGEQSRLLLDLSAPAKSTLNFDPAHRRLVFRLENTRLVAKLKRPPASHPLIGHIEANADPRGLNLRVDLKKAVGVRSFAARQGLQWIIQLSDKPAPGRAGGKEASQKSAVRNAAGSVKSAALKAVSETPVKVPKQAPKQAGRELVIVIDPGHGGKDTGAVGSRGTREKDVVLAIARKLEGMIRAEPGMRPVLTRRSDEFIELGQRAEISRRARADLFISLHADAYINADAKGSSVFTLSEHGASSVAARWLADRENRADLVGGVKLRDKGKVLASVLLDLSQNATIEDSDHVATRILNELQKGQQLHHRLVQKAGFVVLKSPDVPSLLVETAFISNPGEEKNLLSGKYQEQIARAVFRGVRGYFASRGHRRSASPKIAAAGLPSVLVAQE